MQPTTVTILRDAAALARTPDKWIQKTRIDEFGRGCAMGLMDLACGEGSRYGYMFIHLEVEHADAQAVITLAHALGLDAPFTRIRERFSRAELVHSLAQEIMRWNDQPGQTAGNVALGFELAALLEEERTTTQTPVVFIPDVPDEVVYAVL